MCRCDRPACTLNNLISLASCGCVWLSSGVVLGLAYLLKWATILYQFVNYHLFVHYQPLFTLTAPSDAPRLSMYLLILQVGLFECRTWYSLHHLYNCVYNQALIWRANQSVWVFSIVRSLWKNGLIGPPESHQLLLCFEFYSLL